MKDLEYLREEINDVDAKIQLLIKERFKLSKEVAIYKKEHNIPIKDEKYELIKIEKLINLSQLNEKEREYYKKILICILDVSKDIQSDIIYN